MCVLGWVGVDDKHSHSATHTQSCTQLCGGTNPVTASGNVSAPAGVTLILPGQSRSGYKISVFHSF